MLYYGVGQFLPNSMFPIVGKLSKKFRYFLCKHIFDYCGKNVNIERRVLFGSGFRIRIGDNSGLGINCTVCSDIEIGNNVLMGPNCFFLTLIIHIKKKTELSESKAISQEKRQLLAMMFGLAENVCLLPAVQ